MSGSDVRTPEPGEILAGKYEIVRVVAEGGMGVVMEARHVRLGHRVAVKVLRPEVRALPQVAARFDREARAAAQIRGPHSVRVMDVDALPDGSPFMVMEMLEGHDLGHELDTRGPLPPREAVGYVLEACAGMAEAHALGIVHRDLKPSNLFLAQEGGTARLKVLDFGISKVEIEGDVKMTVTSSVLGTPLYMSPEQIRSAKNVDLRTDIWSLGVILYELLTGRPPFDCESATALAAAIVADDVIAVDQRRPELDPGLAAIVMKSLEKKADRRFQTVSELAQALAPFGPEGAPATSAPNPSMGVGASPRPSLPRAEAPTLERADTLAAPVTAPSPARATEPGWATTPAPKGLQRVRVGAAIGVLAALAGAAAWLAFGGADDAGEAAAVELATVPVTPESATPPPRAPGARVPPEPAMPTVTTSSAEPDVDPRPPPSVTPKSPTKQASSALPTAPPPPAKSAPPPPAKNPLRL